MARIVVHVHDHPHFEGQEPGHRVLAGDIIAVLPDGHEFTHAEMNCGNFHVIDVKDAHHTELEHLMEREAKADHVGNRSERIRDVRPSVRKLDHAKLGHKKIGKQDHWTGEKAISRKQLDALITERK